MSVTVKEKPMPKKTSSRSNRTLKNISIKEFIDDYVYRIDLDADYQREKIWTTKQQEELLDSIINDIDIPKIYLVEVKGNKQFDYECIDGKQRMSTLLKFYKPEPDEESPLMIKFLDGKFTYNKLKRSHPSIAEKIDIFELSFTIYKAIDDGRVREIFRRLQLGVRLNSGELLKTQTGTIRDFIYKEIGDSGPFFRNTNLSTRRFSRQFTLAQICLNSFEKAKPDGEFVRARLKDIQDFFESNHDLNKNNEDIVRIKAVLDIMDKVFGKNAINISSRAIAVTAYLFIEELYKKEETALIPQFSKFYLKLLDEIKYNMDRLSSYKSPANSTVMEKFQKYVLQASAEGYSIQRRHDFLKKAFDYYLSPETNGKIIGNK